MEIADQEDQEIDAILLETTAQRNRRAMAYRSKRRRNTLWKKRRPVASRTTQIARALGTKVTYFKMGNFTSISTDVSGNTTTLYNLRDQIGAHPDYAHMRELYNRIQVTAIAWRYLPKDFENGATTNLQWSPLAIVYDSLDNTALSNYVDAHQFEKRQFVSQKEKAGTFACKTQQAAHSIQDLSTFLSAPNQVGYIKLYSTGNSASLVRGYLDIICHCYCYDRK